MDNFFFKWDSDLFTGFKIIDEQHHGLINIINNVLEICFDDQSIDNESLEELYNKLSHYISEHFKTEEQLMKKHNVDLRHIKIHVKAHREFQSYIYSFFEDFSKLTIKENLNEVAEFLIRWLAYHILNMDKSLVNQINYILDDKASPKEAYDKVSQAIESSTEPLLKALKSLFYLISEKNKMLLKLNFELEEKIKMRTTELTIANKKLEHLSMYDELTELPNRRYALKALDHLMNNWFRYGSLFSVIFIDLDHFKQVNDQYGHENGDLILKWVSNFLKTNIRKSDIACRLGGDEFLIICEHCGSDGAMELGMKLNHLSKNVDLSNLKGMWHPSLSIGVTEVDSKCESSNCILKKADTAMYRSKNRGGGLTSLV